MKRKWFAERQDCRARWICLAFGLMILAICSCGSSIALFDPHAYENATILKTETLALMSLAGDPYPTHAEEIQTLVLKIAAAREYAAGIPHNHLSGEQWRVLAGPDLFGGFVSLWEERGLLLPGDIEASRQNVAGAFDEIIRLESGKIRR